MRNPGRKALYCALALLLAAALIRFGAVRHAPTGGDWSSVGPISLGLAIAPFALFTLVQALFAMRGQARLLAGIGVIARWRVPPAEWERFRRLDGRRFASDPSLMNDLWIRKATPAAGAEVIVGERSLIVDGSYHGLRRGGLPELRSVHWLEGPPTCLEFALRYPRGRYGGAVPVALRVPVPASARGAAARVFEHYDAICRPRPGLALRDPRKTYHVCAFLLVAAAGLAAAGFGIHASASQAGVPLAQLALLTGTIVAAIVGSFAILLALATFLLTRR